jgi:hypothetical protein
MTPHVYVIHLKHRKDRKEEFLSTWNNIGLPTQQLHWVDAVYGPNLPDSALASFRTMAKTRRSRAGRVGCYTSHVHAIEKAIQYNHFPLLILEDDAVPIGKIDLGAIFRSAPENTTLLYFGALPVKDRKHVSAVTYCGKEHGWIPPVSDISLYGGHAYGFLTKEAALDVVSFIKKNRMTFDSALIRYTKTYPERIAIFCPFQLFQSSGYSNIEAATRPMR